MIYAMIILNMYLYMKKNIGLYHHYITLQSSLKFTRLVWGSFRVETTNSLHAMIAPMHVIFNYPHYIINVP